MPEIPTPSPAAEDRPRRPVVYFLHGLLQTAHHHFGPQLRAWKDEMTLVPVDLPGHGRCRVDAQSDYMAHAVEYTLAVMKRFGAGHVLAASYLGGPIGVRCALERSDLVESLVLTGFVHDVPHEIFGAWLDGFGRVAAEQPTLAAWYEQTHGARWRDTFAAYADDVRHRYCERVAVTTGMLGALSTPTLIANGSAKSNERATALAAPQLGSAIRGHIIEDAGHVPATDRPDELNAVVRAFWKEIAVAVPHADS
jgi:pimeloyl-ACP methyl ester carboxylesterase